MLSNFHHKIIGSTLHHILAYWELLYRAHNIADRDRRLATSFITYRHRKKYIVLYQMLKFANRRLVMTSIASPILQPLHHISMAISLFQICNGQCAMCKIQIARCDVRYKNCSRTIPDSQYNSSSIVWSLHLIIHILFAWSHICNLIFQPPMQ